jgi:ABC-type transport system involved in multi-copper enzyme maturation permease subunit
MNSPQAIYAFRWLIWETFRHALASRIFWVMLGASTVVILVCLSVSVDGGESLLYAGDIELQQPHGEIALGFGALRMPLFRDGEAAVHFLLLLLAEWVAGAGGVLLALVWTAGFLPAFLRPGAASVLLAKPVPRWALLLGKFLGVLAFVAFQASVFIGGTWLALGVRTGYWPASYILCIPILLLHFASVYSFSVLLAVCTRSTLVCVVGSVLFWLLCWGMNYGRHFVVAMSELDPAAPALPPLFRGLADVAYWMLPKPVDMGMILHQALQVGDSFRSFAELDAVQRMGAFAPEMSVLTGLLFCAAMLGVAARQLTVTDY